MTEQIVIVVGGSGRHAAVVHEAAILSGLGVAGFVAVEEGIGRPLLDCEYLGGPDMLQNRSFLGKAAFVPACGSNVLRQSITSLLCNAGAELATVLHPSAIISPSAVIEQGSVILAGAIVGPSARLGRATIVNHAAIVDHDCLIGDCVNICPGVRLGGAVHVEQGAFVGLNACVLPGRRIGQNAIIGAGSVVIQDVVSGCTVAGNPARPLP